MTIDVSSEIGHLEGVILHQPGIEIEKMVPNTIEECLYSDLLNLNIAKKEYFYFEKVLSNLDASKSDISLTINVSTLDPSDIGLITKGILINFDAVIVFSVTSSDSGNIIDGKYCIVCHLHPPQSPK